MTQPTTAILHYTAPPVVGGVEAVIHAHSLTFTSAGYPVTVVAGWGEAAALPPGVDLVRIPELDSRFELVTQLSSQLEQGIVPPGLTDLARQLEGVLAPILSGFDTVIVHNVFTKHFNLPLTVALHNLLDAGTIPHCIAWCHDLTWTSPHSVFKVHPGYPWDLLRTYRPDATYVVVSERRRQELAQLFACEPEGIRVIYNGVEPRTVLGLSDEGADLVRHLGLLESELVFLMPVRVTQAKNIEYALRLLAATKERGCRPKLVVTGPPDPHDAASTAYFHSLQSLRRELGLEDEMRFVFETGPDPEQGLTISAEVVGDLFRVSDVMLMPSHREGFAMPVLEAGLAGVPIVCTDVPAAMEIGGKDLMLFQANDDPSELAERVLSWLESSPGHRLRRRVRQRYTWQAIMQRDIVPLLERREDG